MLERLDDLPDTVIGVRATGVVSADDYRLLLVPMAKDAIAEHGAVRCLFVIGPERVHFTTGAMLQDAKLGIAQLRSWEKIAVVADSRLVDLGERVTGWVFPGRMKVFAPGEIDAATEWVAS